MACGRRPTNCRCSEAVCLKRGQISGAISRRAANGLGRKTEEKANAGALALALAMVPATGAFAHERSYAEDRAFIEDLSNYYMAAVNAGDIATVMETWADDGVLNGVGGVEQGRAAIEER